MSIAEQIAALESKLAVYARAALVAADDRDVWQANANAHREEVERAYKDRDDLKKERDDLRRQLDALTRPIDGVEELGRIGLEAWQKAACLPVGERIDADDIAADAAEAQAIASRVIGALWAAYIDARTLHGAGLDAQYFDRAVASLKIEPAKAEPAPPVDTRPVVKVGQVWGSKTRTITFRVVDVDQSISCARDQNGRRMNLSGSIKPMSDDWVLVSNEPSSKREPFELPGNGRTFSVGDGVAIRDRIQEIERRLEAGGL